MGNVNNAKSWEEVEATAKETKVEETKEATTETVAVEVVEDKCACEGCTGCDKKAE